MPFGFLEISGLVALLEGPVDRGKRARIAGEASQAAGGAQRDGAGFLTQGRLQRPSYGVDRSALVARRRQQLAAKTQQLGSVIVLVALIGPSRRSPGIAGSSAASALARSRMLRSCRPTSIAPTTRRATA